MNLNNIKLIGISGKIGSGKDTVGKIIQSLDIENNRWQIKKFASKLKEIVSILTNISLEDLEREDIKNSKLPNNWNRFYLSYYKLQTDKNPKGKISQYFSTYQEVINYIEGLKNSDNLGGYIIASNAIILEESITVRELLQTIGTDVMRNTIHPNIWCNGLFSEFNDMERWIVTDVRFPNEYKTIIDNGGIMIRVNSDRIDIFDDKYQHSSETLLDGYTFNYVIDNSSTIEDLKKTIQNLC